MTALKGGLGNLYLHPLEPQMAQLVSTPFRTSNGFHTTEKGFKATTHH